MDKVLEKQTYNQELTELTDKFLSIPTPKRRETKKQTLQIRKRQPKS